MCTVTFRIYPLSQLVSSLVILSLFYNRGCLSFCPSLTEPLSLTLSESMAITLVSCRERNLKGSRINKSKVSQTKLQRGFGRHAGSGAMCAHKELSVRVVVLRIPVEYSLSHTPHTSSVAKNFMNVDRPPRP